MEIIDLLSRHEGKTLEFKENTQPKDKILATVIAFSNTSGGKIIIGVEDKTRVIRGVSNPPEEEERLSSIIFDNIAPTILFNIETLAWRNTHILIIDVPMSSSRPHYLKNKGINVSTYFRVSSTNRIADEKMIENIQRSLSIRSFDEDTCFGSTDNDLDIDVIEKAFARSITEPELLSMGIKNKHENGSKPSIGGVLCFSKDKTRFFPDAWIQAGCFLGGNKNQILDSLEIKTYLHLSIEQALNFIRKHLKVGLNIEGLVHQEQWEIPLKAIREALLNAVVHADYSLHGAPIRISIFDDRIEIDNSGLLPYGLTVDDIKDGFSKIRNRVISRVFRELKQIEQWGSGIRRIIDACTEVGLESPVFEEITDRFRVTLYRKRKTRVLVDSIDRKILTLILQNALSTKHIADKVGLSSRSVRPRLVRLAEKSLVIEIAQSHKDPTKTYALTKEGVMEADFKPSKPVYNNVDDKFYVPFDKENYCIKVVFSRQLVSDHIYNLSLHDERLDKIQKAEEYLWSLLLENSSFRQMIDDRINIELGKSENEKKFLSKEIVFVEITAMDIINKDWRKV
jgi:predicted HTH transcriptional regulator